MVKFGLVYDFRNPPEWQVPSAELYDAHIAQIQRAEELGFDHVWITEHHFIDDGYTPSVLPVAAAVARETRTIRIGTWVLLLPLHNALRVAEDAAAVDILSHGRFELGLGLGYRIEEFDGFGVDRRARGRMMDESVEIVQRGLAGETFSFEGEFYQHQKVRVTPGPVQQPFPIWLGARSVPAAKRAARFRAPLMIVAGRDIYEAYVAEHERLGQDPAEFEILASMQWFVSENPDRDWPRLREHVRYFFATYGKWYAEAADLPGDGAYGGASDDQLRQMINIGTPDQVKEAIAAARDQVPFQHLIAYPTLPGVPTELSTQSIELFSHEVLPAFA